MNHDGWGERCRSTMPGRRVVLYVRTSYGEDAEPVIDQLRHRAEARRWTVDRVIHDQVSMGAGPRSSPECWPGWRTVRDLINNRWVHGVLAPDRSDISTDDTLYVRELRRIAADGAFTALLTRESVPSRTLRCRLEARGIGWRQIAAQLLLVLAVGAAVPSLLLSTFTP
ncbi:hypothetical protein ACIRQY_34575 [Streptomyces sp. NPDC101490]|uniref:hypothetical protein n=1 Tax=Streptomyces sp. NPDC101490 TaxID=3366143 RepID=UPI00380B8896